jgi:hypothetical protein
MLPGQLIMKAPIVVPCLPSLQSLQAGTPALFLLAADSGIAGILLITGAAFRGMIIQGVEHHVEMPVFLACARTGIRVTVINPPVCAMHLCWLN